MPSIHAETNKIEILQANASILIAERTTNFASNCARLRTSVPQDV